MGPSHHLLGRKAKVSDRGSDFKFLSARVRGASPSGAATDGSIKCWRSDADRLRESSEESGCPPTAETGDTCGGGAGAGCVAKGGRRRYAAGYRAVLGGRGESVGRGEIESGGYYFRGWIRGCELVGDKVGPVPSGTHDGIAPVEQMAERTPHYDDGSESGRSPPGHLVSKGRICFETRGKGVDGTLAAEGCPTLASSGRGGSGLDTTTLQTLIDGCPGEVSPGGEDSRSASVREHVTDTGGRIVVPLCPAFPTRPRAVLDPQMKYKIPEPPPPPRARVMGEGIDSGAPDVFMTYSGLVTVAAEGQQISPPTDREAGMLAPISKARLNLDRLVELDTNGILLGIIDVIRDVSAFEALFVPGTELTLGSRPTFRGTSRHMLRHMQHLEEWGVVERSDQQKVVLPAFTVPKSSGGLRLVCDGRKLNRMMRPPPPMLLPGIRAVIARFLSARYVAQDDGKSWFYQFPLGQGIDDYFGVNLSGARGPFVRAKLRALCMGWSWAPCIAHRSAMVLLPESDGVAWVDNFFVVGDSEEETAQRYSSFKRRADYVGAHLSDAEDFGVPTSNSAAINKI